MKLPKVARVMLLACALLMGGLSTQAQKEIIPSNVRIVFSPHIYDNEKQEYIGTNIYSVNLDGSGFIQLIEDIPEVNNFSPVWSPDGTKIAFSSNRAAEDLGMYGAYDIFTMDADGTNIRQLTTDPNDEYWPQWSPDGTKIAYDIIPWRLPYIGVYVINLDGTGKTRLARGYRPLWSPDGTKIAFFFKDHTRVFNIQLGIYDRNNSKQVKITTHLGATDFSWSPDSQSLIFISGYDIYRVDVDGSNLHILTENDTVATPKWSPDGRYIAFTREGNIYLMNRDGSQQWEVANRLDFLPEDREYEVADDDISLWEPKWLPNDLGLIFVVYRSGIRHRPVMTQGDYHYDQQEIIWLRWADDAPLTELSIKKFQSVVKVQSNIMDGIDIFPKLTWENSY